MTLKLVERVIKLLIWQSRWRTHGVIRAGILACLARAFNLDYNSIVDNRRLIRIAFHEKRHKNYYHNNQNSDNTH